MCRDRSEARRMRAPPRPVAVRAAALRADRAEPLAAPFVVPFAARVELFAVRRAAVA